MPKEYFSNLSDHKSPPTYKYFSGEKWVESRSGKTREVISPVDLSVLGRIQVVTNSEIDQALQKAKKAQIAWREITIVDRAKRLHLAADWMRHHEHMMTSILVKEIGKTILDAKDEVLRSADMIDYFASEALNIRGEQISGEAKLAIVERVPLGLILAISPFNYPINLSVSKIAPAIMMGNSVVLKPSSCGSISSLFLTEIFRMAGIPDGVIVTITGSGEEAGEYLAIHSDINMVSFTGSSDVGKKLSGKIGMIPVLYECGGNNPAIVLPDADMDLTADEIVKGAFSYAGQRCTAIKYVLGMEPTLDKLMELVVEKTKKTVKLGDPRIEGNNLGPVISEKSAMEIEKRIILAKSEGARISYGGGRKGLFMEPTIIDNARFSMDIVHKETFGPVVSFVPIESLSQGIDIINSSKFGLQTSVFTKDEESRIKIGEKINSGSVQLNSAPQREPDMKGGVQGIRYTLEAMSRLKPIILNKPR